MPSKKKKKKSLSVGARAYREHFYHQTFSSKRVRKIAKSDY